MSGRTTWPLPGAPGQSCASLSPDSLVCRFICPARSPVASITCSDTTNLAGRPRESRSFVPLLVHLFFGTTVGPAAPSPSSVDRVFRLSPTEQTSWDLTEVAPAKRGRAGRIDIFRHTERCASPFPEILFMSFVGVVRFSAHRGFASSVAWDRSVAFVLLLLQMAFLKFKFRCLPLYIEIC